MDADVKSERAQEPQMEEAEVKDEIDAKEVRSWTGNQRQSKTVERFSRYIK